MKKLRKQVIIKIIDAKNIEKENRRLSFLINPIERNNEEKMAIKLPSHPI